MTQETEVVNERHVFRALFKLAILTGLVFLAGRFIAQKKNEYANLTESQARDKLIDSIAPTVGDETAEDIADQVIPKLKDRGLIKPDPVEEAMDKVEDVAKKATKKAGDVKDDVADKVGDAADKVTEAVESVVKD